MLSLLCKSNSPTGILLMELFLLACVGFELSFNKMISKQTQFAVLITDCCPFPKKIKQVVGLSSAPNDMTYDGNF